MKASDLGIKRVLEYARNTFFVEAPEGTGQEVFAMAGSLLRQKDVELCHPELVRRMGWRTAFPQQWHLKKTTIDGTVYDAHANVEAAWAHSEGENITIAIIDDGVDIDHEEFAGSGKLIAPRDVTRANDDPRPGSRDNHGTACAGVATGNGFHGASGVAPKARLMAIRYASPLGSQAEADAFIWAAQHGADVISCSWGPEDGAWWDPRDPLHHTVVPLPDSTRLAIDWAATNGRNGKGCVITWAAGNGNESVDNDGYASYEKVIAVAACHAKGKRSVYSDFGKAIWCTFPSNDTVLPIPGIWTTDRSGAAGYNPGQVSRG
ncbi:MAG: S8 family serine peptidase, partial [Nitrospirales bacterium]